MTLTDKRIYLIKQLLNENKEYANVIIPSDEDGQRQLLRGLMNVRMPQSADSEFIRIQDEYLQEILNQKGIVDIDDLMEIKPGIILWKGDITRLRCDAVVNAANSGMTGCYRPNHNCIDNCIHTYAGVQLRKKCAELMEKEGHEEPVGHAKITPGYNLPARYILHTVGPIINGELREENIWQLESCYQSCLELAASNNLHSVAFCCISTGVFMFPNRPAAEIAIKTVKNFLKKDTSVEKVVFNVFKDNDEEIYAELLG